MALEVVKEKETESGVRLGRPVNFGCIFGGTLVMLALGLIAAVFGNAIGLGLVNFTIPTASTGLLTGTWIYNCVALVGVFFVGGAVTSSLSHLMGTRVGMAHAIVSWSLAIVATTYFGFMMTVTTRIVVAGLASNGLNWLLFCTLFFSLIASAAGGITGVRKSERMEKMEVPPSRRVA